ncbi:hypothetical protein QFZ77_006945 [Paenibacillus sp. V4I3]|uniref:RNA-binding domain-containing protein n=1 Tax=Paenibacillus sp. V4I3 TaxID=3042305 RepID=UPI00277EACA6|nr:RNA-binding domain-containing protein [Paenibacillus sp. V4I3]MDQ0878286.1 hypothetical protein [Paenibacillus sp. V4I3]
MTTFHKAFDEVKENDLKLLIESGATEGLQLEFKETISNNISLVEEVVAFANTQGGDLFIGVKERDGTPVNVSGIDINPDQEILKYKQWVETNTDPALTNILYRHISLANGGHVIHIRVPRSWNGPHMVKNYKFMIRTASAKVPAGTSDIRRMMNVRDHFLEQYNRFRVQRIEKTLNVYKQETPLVLVHFLPTSAFDIESNYPITERRNSINLSILGGSGYNQGINAHGLYYQSIGANGYRGHTQVFRSAIIEQVSNLSFNYRKSYDEPRKEFFSATHFENSLRESILNQLINYRELNMQDPFYIFVNIIGARGVIGSSYGASFISAPQSIDDDFLQLPEIMIDSHVNQDLERVISTIINYLWNAFGFVSKPEHG